MKEMGSTRLVRMVGAVAGVVSLLTAGGLTTADAADSGPLGAGTRLCYRLAELMATQPNGGNSNAR